jgi:hypothetical protein
VRAWLTPDTPAPESERCRRFATPDELAFVAAVTGALLPLTYAENWEQQGSMSPDEAAGIMSGCFERFVASDCEGMTGDCPPVKLPGGVKIYRISPTTGHWEVLEPEFGATWVEPTGGEAIPYPPEAREEATEESRKCAAATNAVYVLAQLYHDVVTSAAADLDAYQAATNLAAAAAALLGGFMSLPALGIIALAEAIFNAFYELAGAIAVNLWDDEFSKELTCVLANQATEADGVVTFDFFGFNQAILEQVWVNSEYAILVAQVLYLTSIIGQDGLNLAGATTAVAGNCADCGTWCVTGTPEQLGFEPDAGGCYITSLGHLTVDGGGFKYVLAERIVDTSNCKITRVGFTTRANGATNSTIAASALPSDGPISQVWASQGMTGFPIGRTTNDNSAWQSNSSETTIGIYASNDASGSYLLIEAVYIFGTGLNPFGIGSNC